MNSHGKAEAVRGHRRFKGIGASIGRRLARAGRAAWRESTNTLPGVGVTVLCAAMAAAIIVPAIESSPPQGVAAPHASTPAKPATALTSSTTLPSGCATTGDTVTCHWTTYGSFYSEKTGTVTIPAGVGTVHFQLNGAVGGAVGGAYGGSGAMVSGTLDMNAIPVADHTLDAIAGADGVGPTGRTAGSGGSPDGGAGANGNDEGSAGGGGWTGITTSFGTVVAMAGGGGGAGGWGAGQTPTSGGSGGKTGGSGASGSGTCSGGGSGGGGASQSGAGGGGGGHGCTAGGGGASGSGHDGGAGGFGGGDATIGDGGGGGGGGGAGWYGGGGGGGGGDNGSGGGGGGGSSGVHGTTWVRTVGWTCNSASKTCRNVTGSTKSSGWAYVSLSWTLVPTYTYLTAPSSAQDGQTVNLQAQVTAGTTAHPTGTVDFYSKTGAEICTAVSVNLNWGGGESIATCSYRLTSTGTRQFHATFVGNNTYAGSRSTTRSVTTGQDTTGIGQVTVTATTSLGPRLTAKLSPPSFAPTALKTATVTFYWSTSRTGPTTEACSTKVSAPAGASVTPECRWTTAVPGRTYWFTATFAGQGNDAAAASTPVTYLVPKSTPKVTLSAKPTTSPQYGQAVTLHVAVSGLPNQDTHPGSVLFESTTGSKHQPLTCLGIGQRNPLPGSNTGGRFTGTCTFLPGATGTISSETVVADYNSGGTDNETTTTVTSNELLAVTKATATTTLTATPTPAPVGATVTLEATVADGNGYPKTPIGGTVVFDEGGTPVSTCTAVLVSTGAASCNYRAPATLTTTLSFSATYCSTSVGKCTDWKTSRSSSVTVKTVADPTEVVLDPAASQASPYTLAGGTPVTVVANVSVTAGSEPVAGAVTFKQNGNPIAAVGGGTCTDVAVTSGAARCTFLPVTGNEDTVVATFAPSGSLLTRSTSEATFLKVSGTATTTVVTVPSGAAYGVPITATATVTAKSKPVASGTVAFSVDGSPVAACSAQPVALTTTEKAGNATCTLPSTMLAAGNQSVGASFAYAGGTFKKSTGVTSFTETAAPTAASISVGPTSSADDLVTVTVTNTAKNAVTAPAGTVTVALTPGSSACTGTLGQPSGPTAVATCQLQRPTATTPPSKVTYSASYTPSDGDFNPLTTPATLTMTPGAACSSTPAFTTATFTRAWALAGQTLTLSVDGGAAYGSLGLTLGSVSGPCKATATIPFTKASLDLFGKTLASSSVTGYVVGKQGSGTPQVCLTGGTLGLPSGWSIGSVTLSATEKLCFALTNVTGSAGTLGAPSGSLTVSGSSLPFGFPGTSGDYDLTLGFLLRTSEPVLTVHVAPPAPPVTSPWVTLNVSVTKTGPAFGATGALEVENLPFLSGAVKGAFTVSTGTAGSISGAATLTALPTTATYSPVPGLTLEKLSLGLSSATGLTFSASAALGDGDNPVTVSLSGKYSSHLWHLHLTTTKLPNWEPISGVTLSATISGTLTITTAGGTTKVTYDFEGGKSPKTGAAPLFAWKPGGGVTVTLGCVALAFGVTANCGAGPTSSSPTDPTLFAQGSIAFGATGTGSGITAGFEGSIDLKSGHVNLAYDSTVGTLSGQPVTGLTLSLTSLVVTGNAGGVNVAGSAQATVTSLHTSVAVTFQDKAGILVVSGRPTFNGIHVPLTGVFAYATGTVTTYDTRTPTVGTAGMVDLSAGFSVFAAYHPTAAVDQALQSIDARLGTGAAVVLTGHWKPGGSPSFSASLDATGGLALLSLPDTGSLTSLTLSYGTNNLSLSAAGKIPVPGASPAPITLSITIGTGAKAGTFTGRANVTHLSIFGTSITLAGQVKRTSGKVTADITASVPGPMTPFSGVPFTLSTVTFSLGTSGIQVGATMTVDTLGSLKFTGSLTKLETWSASVTATASRPWSPVPDVTFTPSFKGTVADASGTVTFSLVATGANGSSLFTFSPGPVTLAVSEVGLGNASPPGACTVTKAGDLWLAVDGSLGITIGGAGGTATATGCFDLTAKSFSLSAKVASLAFSALTGHVVFGAPTVTVSESNGAYQVAANATLTVTMPSGGSLVVRAVLAFESGGGFVIGAEVNLSQWLGSDGNFAYLYYSSKRVSSFDTGDPTLQKIDLVSGITFAVAISLPATAVEGLNKIGITLPAGTAFKAIGTATFTSDIYQLTISVALGTGIKLVTSGGVTLLLDSGFLQVTLAPSNVTFGLGLTATLDLPSPGGIGGKSHVALAGELSISTTGINFTLSLGHCGSTTTAWFTAFGAPGLTVQCAALTGGVTYEFPFIDLGLAGTITHLPSVISTVVGYQNGAPISFAFNLDPFLLKLSIGTKNSSTPALEPLAFVGQGTLIKVYYASIYIAPQAVTIGSTTYAAGVSMGFQATLFSVNVSILASIGFSPPSITFTATISKITLHGLSIGPVSVVLAASPSNFKFQFTGTASLGPGMADIGPTLKVGGHLTASVQIELSTSKLSAFIWGSVGVTVSAWLATRTCYTATIFPYPCDYKWKSTGFTVTLGKTGFSVTSTGITLEADGYSVTFDYDGHVSASLARAERPRSDHGRETHHHGHHSMPPMALAATRQPLTPASSPVPPATGPRLTGGKAVLVPSSTPTKSGSGGAGGTGGVAATPVTGKPVGSWGSAASMSAARAFPATATLRSGDVLVAGGASSSKNVLSSSEVYNPATNKWSSAGPLATARVGATATVLKDGKVLIAGGFGATKAPLRTAELFDPASGTFSSTGSMHGARAFASSELLPDGDVLVVGGVGTGHTPLETAELYDPKTGTFSATGSMATAHAFAAVASLPDGDVLVAGGEDATGPLATAERYDPSAGTWSAAGKMSQPRLMASAVTLPDDDVLVVGDAADGDLYDPSSGTWTYTKGMGDAATLPAVAALPGGQVLVAGGESAGSSTGQAQLYQPATASWKNAGSMSTTRVGAAVAVLSNGQVLLAGGGNVTGEGGGQPTVTVETTAELYSPPASASVQPTSRPAGAPFVAVVTSSTLPIALGSAGAAVVLAGLAFVAYERRRRLTARPAEIPTDE